jgi:hypothetical protein
MLAVLRYASRRLLRRGGLPVAAAARRSWIVHPAERARRPRALFLDGHLDRVEAFQEETTREAERARVLGGVVEHAAVRVHELPGAILAGGSVYAGGARVPLAPGSLLDAVSHRAPVVLDRAAVDCTWVGNRYFGHWLTDDCTLHLLARDLAPPIGVERAAYLQEEGYLRLLGLRSWKLSGARIGALLVFEDFAQGSHKRARYERLRAALAAHAGPRPAAGVYLRRGASGVHRPLANEVEIEARLARRGFAVVDPEATSAEELVRACAGAASVVAVEGSALAHGVLTVAPGGALVALQPPWRFNNVVKDYADCLGLRYAFTVGMRVEEGFRIDPDDLDRTLDLCAVP